MRTFLLIGSDDNGVNAIRVTKADSIQEAIEDRFEFAPLDRRKIIKEMQEAGEITSDQVHLYLSDSSEESLKDTYVGWESKEVRQKVLHAMRNRATEFFNLRKDSGYDGRAVGNYVDGDSVSSWIIIEVESGGSVFVYPTPQSLVRD
jgi:hypothetical protein